MTNPNVSSAVSSARIRAVINDFLEERLQPKLDKLKDGDNEKRQKLLEDHQPEPWIASAAKRVAQIQQVTHALKFTHPDARGTSLNAPGNPNVSGPLIGTHILDEAAPDVVGNAAALDVYKFLKLEIGGKTLLDLAISGDNELREAFSSDAEEAENWMAAFADLVEPKGAIASHKLAKQLFWPIQDGEYHLLAPLFPTSLAHHAWGRIREDRFSQEAKEARQAFWAGESHPHGFCEYPDLAVQNFGGTKPQNISQLNSERYGENYLLAAVPPIWRSERVRPPLKVESVFGGFFSRRREVRRILGILNKFLVSVQNHNNLPIRRTRAGLIAQLTDELLVFAAEIQELEPGWSRDEACRLNAEEQCWLDPGRAEEDADFAKIRHAGEWQEMICKRFANWLNAQLNSTKLPMSKYEAKEWESVLAKEMKLMHRELDLDE